ncbi:MAG: DUF2182 domain-containing protein [Hyphomicrobiaceae bacterium]
MSATSPVESLLRRDRLIVSTGLIIIIALSWAWLLSGAGTGMSVSQMTTWSFPPPMRQSMPMAWELAYWITMLGMWWVMMIAMMTPSAAPMILLYARALRHAQAKGKKATGPVPTAWFLAGYLASWFGFSVAATVVQWGLEQAGLLHGMMMWSLSRPLSGALLVAAGIYQLSPFKSVCLEHCRSPAEFLSKHWRDGQSGAFVMGIAHGNYCIGCCWVLMALLFVGGTMNLVWIAGLAAIVLAEKILPAGHRVAPVIGGFLIAAGLWVWIS